MSEPGVNNFDIKESVVFVEACHTNNTLLNNKDMYSIDIYNGDTKLPIEHLLDIIWWYADRD